MQSIKTPAVVLLLGILSSLILACAEVPRPLSAGTSVSNDPGQSIVFGRIAIVRDGEDRMSTSASFPRSFGWELLLAQGDRKFVVDSLTENGLFALALPAGIYHVTKLRYEDWYGAWEGTVAASFSVKPGTITYLGTWEITFAGLGPGVSVTARTSNNLEEDHDEFDARYAIDARPLTVAMIQSTAEGHFALLRPRSEY